MSQLIPSSVLRPPTRWWRRMRTLRGELMLIEGWTGGALALLALLGIWWLVTGGLPGERLISSYALPGPAETFASFPDLWQRGLSLSALTSLFRVCCGFVIAAAVGIPLGLLSGSYTWVAALCKPFSIFGRNIPIAALISLTVVWWGIGELQKVMFIFLSSVAFVLFDSTSAARAVPDRYLETAYTLGARHNWSKGLALSAFLGAIYALLASAGWAWLKGDETLATAALGFAFWARAAVGFAIGLALWLPLLSHQVLRKVVVPMALPDIVNSLRLLFGLAFGYIMLAEVINAKRGLGALIITSERQGPREHIILILLVISVLAWAIDRMLLLIQRQAFPYLKHGQD